MSESYFMSSMQRSKLMSRSHVLGWTLLSSCLKAPWLGLSLLLVLLVGFVNPVSAQSIVESVRERGSLRCGVNNQLPGFGSVDSDGQSVGFDIDICRAVSAAMFGDPDQVEFVFLTSANRQSALQAGEVDIISRNTTWTLTRDRDWGATFGPTTYYDGQGFMVPKSLGITMLEELDGATICVLAGTTTELNLADTFAARGLEFSPVVSDVFDTSFEAYEQGRCDAITTDGSSLISRKVVLQNPDDHLIMDAVISKEPLGPVVPQGDTQWADIMNWTVYALFYAEEVGITSENIDTFSETEDPNIRRFLGLDGDLGELLGLDPDWTVDVIKSVGNYGEIFDRNLTPLGVSRGLNRPYTEGGIQYAPAFR